MQSHYNFDYSNHTIDFIPELKVPGKENISERAIRKEIIQFNNDLQILKKKLGNRLLTTAEPDFIIAVYLFFSKQQAQLNKIKTAYETIKNINVTLSNKEQLNTLLDQAKDFIAWTEATIPDELEKRKKVISISMPCIPSWDTTAAESKSLGNHIEHISRTMEIEELKLYPEVELNFLFEKSSRDDSANFLLSNTLELIQKLVLAAPLNTEKAIQNFNKLLEILKEKIKHEDSYTDERKTKLLMNFILGLAKTPDSPAKTEIINTILPMFNNATPLPPMMYTNLSIGAAFFEACIKLDIYHKNRNILYRHLKCLMSYSIFGETFTYESTITPILLKAKEYELIRELYNLNGRFPHETRRLISCIISLESNIPDTLKDLCQLDEAQQIFVSCNTLLSESFEDSMNFIFKCLDKIYHHFKNHVSATPHLNFLAKSILKRYPHEQILNYITTFEKEYDLECAGYTVLPTNSQHNFLQSLKQTASKLRKNRTDNTDIETQTNSIPISYCDTDIQMPVALYLAVMQKKRRNSSLILRIS